MGSPRRFSPRTRRICLPTMDEWPANFTGITDRSAGCADDSSNTSRRRRTAESEAGIAQADMIVRTIAKWRAAAGIPGPLETGHCPCRWAAKPSR